VSLRLFTTEPLTLRFASASMDDEFGVKRIAPLPSTCGGWRRLDMNSIAKGVVEGKSRTEWKQAVISNQ